MPTSVSFNCNFNPSTNTLRCTPTSSGNSGGNHSGSSSSGSSRDYPSGSGRGDHDGGGNGSGSGRRGWSDYESKDNGSSTVVPFSPGASDFERLFDHPEVSKGVMNLNSMYYPQVKHVHSLSHLINVRSTMPSGWGHNVFKNITELHLANNLLTDVELSPLLASLSYQELNLRILDLSYNKFTTNIVGELLRSITNEPGNQPHNIQVLKLNNNQFDDDTAKYFSWHISSGTLPQLKSLDLSGNHFTSVGLEHLATSVRKIKAKTIAIKVAAADTLQGMKEFITKGFNYYTKTHKVVATKEFQDELLGVNSSPCEKTKDNVKEAFLTGAFIASLTTGNDVLILAAGAEAGAGALLSPDAFRCVNALGEKAHDWMFGED